MLARSKEFTCKANKIKKTNKNNKSCIKQPK